MTQAEVAGDDLSVSYVSLLEAGRRQPTAETVELLARALDCDPAELTGAVPSALARPVSLILRQAELNLEVGKADTAREQFEQVLAADPEDPETRVRAMTGRARSLHRAGRLVEAAEAYEQGVRSGLLDPAGSASTKMVLSWCRCLYELGELHRAAEIGRLVLEELANLKARDSEQSIQLIATVAATWYELGDLRQAEALLAEGMERAASVQSPAARGAILWNASTVAHERGRYQQALELADEALAALRHGSSPQTLGRLMTTRGYFLLRGDPPRPDEALRVLDEAVSMLGEYADVVDLAYALTERSRACLLLDRVDEAVAAAERARSLIGRSARLEQARATIALAAAVHRTGDPARSRAMFTEAAENLEQIGASRTAARGWIELGLILADGGDSAAAIDALVRGAAAVNLVEPHLHASSSILRSINGAAGRPTETATPPGS